MRIVLHPLTLISTAILLCLSSLPGLSIPTPILLSRPPGSESIIFKAQDLPPGTGSPDAPTRTSRGRTRTGTCFAINPQAADQSIVALVPLAPKTGLSYGVTTQERPALWLHIPYRATSAGYAELVLQNDQEQIVYRQKAIAIAGTPGFVRIALSDSAPALEIGKTYRWYFSTYCKSTDLNEPTQFVGGYLQRQPLSPALQAQLQQATPVEQVKRYAENGIWHDALDVAANLQRTSPGDRSWAALLEAVKLGNLASEPVAACCRGQ